MNLLADNEAINKWLSENPMVLGGMFLVIGLVVAGFGVVALLTGRSTGKYGHKMEGPMAYLHGAIMAFFGGGFALFGLFKLVIGLMR